MQFDLFAQPHHSSPEFSIVTNMEWNICSMDQFLDRMFFNKYTLEKKHTRTTKHSLIYIRLKIIFKMSSQKIRGAENNFFPRTIAQITMNYHRQVISYFGVI